MPDRSYRRRTRGSVRFDPYFTLEWYDAVFGVWRPDRGARFETAWQARDATAGRTVKGRLPEGWRVMEVTTHGRAPVGRDC